MVFRLTMLHYVSSYTRNVSMGIDKTVRKKRCWSLLKNYWGLFVCLCVCFFFSTIAIIIVWLVHITGFPRHFTFNNQFSLLTTSNRSRFLNRSWETNGQKIRWPAQLSHANNASPEDRTCDPLIWKPMLSPYCTNWKV